MPIPMPIRILLVEDDEHISGAIATFLTDAGYIVDTCTDGNDAYVLFYSNSYQLVILDIMLPGIGGHQLLREFRKLNDTPVLICTALGDEDSQLRAFSAEADDYVTKPFRMQILLKRVEALLRRSGALARELRWGRLVLLPDSRTALCDGTPLELTRKEFEILLLLVKQAGRTLTHETILARVWGYDFRGDAGTVHTHIKNLRAKLPSGIIKTARGIGYRLDVQFVEKDEA